MTKIIQTLLLCAFTLLLFNTLFSQKTNVDFGNSVTISTGPNTSSCQNTSNCNGIQTEYFIIDLQTQVSSGGFYITGTSVSNVIDPTAFGFLEEIVLQSILSAMN